MALFEYFDGTSWIPTGANTGGTVTSVGITGSTGLSISGSPITSSGVINLTLGSELQALSAFASNGLMVRTGSGSYAGRTLIGSTGINITNGDGLSGNPTISVSTIDIDTNTTGSLSPSRLTGYPSNSSLFLNGIGNWVTVPFSNITTSSATYIWSINNTNTSATATEIMFKKAGSNRFAIGLNSSTNEGYITAFNVATIAFGIFGVNVATIDSSGDWDLLTHSLVTSGDISAKTGTLKANNISTYNSSFLVCADPLDMTSNKITNLGTPVSSTDAVNKNYADTSTISPSRLTGYPSNSSLFLNGSNNWTIPQLADLTTSSTTYRLSINNTNTTATETEIMFKEAGVDRLAVGTNNSVDGSYIMAYGSTLKIGANGLIGAVLDLSANWDFGNKDLITTGIVNVKTGILTGNNIASYNSTNISFSNPIDMNSNKIKSVATPTASTDAANKSYVDSFVPDVTTVLNTTVTAGRKLIAFRYNITSTINSGVLTTISLPSVLTGGTCELLSINIVEPANADGTRSSYGYSTNGINGGIVGTNFVFKVSNAKISSGSQLVAIILGFV